MSSTEALFWQKQGKIPFFCPAVLLETGCQCSSPQSSELVKPHLQAQLWGREENFQSHVDNSQKERLGPEQDTPYEDPSYTITIMFPISLTQIHARAHTHTHTLPTGKYKPLQKWSSSPLEESRSQYLWQFRNSHHSSVTWEQQLEKQTRNASVPLRLSLLMYCMKSIKRISFPFVFYFLFVCFPFYFCFFLHGWKVTCAENLKKKSIRKNTFLEAATCKRERKMKRKWKKDDKNSHFQLLFQLFLNKKKNTSTVHGYQGEWMQHDKDVIVILLIILLYCYRYLWHRSLRIFLSCFCFF